MARFGGMGTESFYPTRGRLSSAPGGLGSILRDQKAASGANRMHILLGQSSPSSGAAGASRSFHSFSSFPIMESNGLVFPNETEMKNEDMFAMDMKEDDGRSLSPDPLHPHRLLRTYDPSSACSQKSSLSPDCHGSHSLKHSKGSAYADAPKRPESSRLADTMLSAYLTADELTEISLHSADVIPAEFGSTQLRSAMKVSERRQVAPPNLISPQSIPSAYNRTLHGSYLPAEHHSAPLNIPNLSGVPQNDTENDFDSAEGCEDDEERLPPHEILAREYAQKERVTFSVCEGQGRTLKGRDMRRVRNAVWRQIGFAD